MLRTIVALVAPAFFEAEQMGYARLHEAPFLLVENVFDEQRCSFSSAEPVSSSSAIRQRILTMSASAQ